MPWAIAVAAIGAAMNKESSIPDISMGTIYTDTTRTKPKEKQCGWKCTGCHATNGAHESQCSWCRTYRLEEKEAPTDPLPAKWYEEELRMRKAAREAIRKNDPSVYKEHPKESPK